MTVKILILAFTAIIWKAESQLCGPRGSLSNSIRPPFANPAAESSLLSGCSEVQESSLLPETPSPCNSPIRSASFGQLPSCAPERFNSPVRDGNLAVDTSSSNGQQNSMLGCARPITPSFNKETQCSTNLRNLRPSAGSALPSLRSESCHIPTVEIEPCEAVNKPFRSTQQFFRPGTAPCGQNNLIQPNNNMIFDDIPGPVCLKESPDLLLRPSLNSIGFQRPNSCGFSGPNDSPIEELSRSNPSTFGSSFFPFRPTPNSCIPPSSLGPINDKFLGEADKPCSTVMESPNIPYRPLLDPRGPQTGVSRICSQPILEETPCSTSANAASPRFPLRNLPNICGPLESSINPILQEIPKPEFLPPFPTACNSEINKIKSINTQISDEIPNRLSVLPCPSSGSLQQGFESCNNQISSTFEPSRFPFRQSIRPSLPNCGPSFDTTLSTDLPGPNCLDNSLQLIPYPLLEPCAADALVQQPAVLSTFNPTNFNPSCLNNPSPISFSPNLLEGQNNLPSPGYFSECDTPYLGPVFNNVPNFKSNNCIPEISGSINSFIPYPNLLPINVVDERNYIENIPINAQSPICGRFGIPPQTAFDLPLNSPNCELQNIFCPNNMYGGYTPLMPQSPIEIQPCNIGPLRDITPTPCGLRQILNSLPPHVGITGVFNNACPCPVPELVLPTTEPILPIESAIATASSSASSAVSLLGLSATSEATSSASASLDGPSVLQANAIAESISAPNYLQTTGFPCLYPPVNPFFPYAPPFSPYQPPQCAPKIAASPMAASLNVQSECIDSLVPVVEGLPTISEPCPLSATVAAIEPIPTAPFMAEIIIPIEMLQSLVDPVTDTACETVVTELSTPAVESSIATSTSTTEIVTPTSSITTSTSSTVSAVEETSPELLIAELAPTVSSISSTVTSVSDTPCAPETPTLPTPPICPITQNCNVELSPIALENQISSSLGSSMLSSSFGFPFFSSTPLMYELLIPSSIPAQLSCCLGSVPTTMPVIYMNVEPVC